MPNWIKQRVLITVRTYPVPSEKSIEASCTAGVTDRGEWLRLFPVPYRLMDQEKRFSKWQWIEVNTLRATSDPSRPESYKIDPNSIMVGETVGPQSGWEKRRKILEPLRRSSMCKIQQERDQNGSPTLGFFHPFRIKQLLIEPADAPQWTDSQLASLRRQDLFQKGPVQPLEKIPFDFRYEFRCGDVDCKGHKMVCTDWEMSQSYRRWRREYGDKWERAFRQRYETEMINKTETHFFVGTLHQHPKNWIVVGLFYPPKVQPLGLFQ
jgi:hypothetical protein